MKHINIHIDRLILEGIALPHHQRPQLQAAVEAELTRLLTMGDLAAVLQANGNWSRINGDDIQLQGESDPFVLGKQIALAVYRRIGQ